MLLCNWLKHAGAYIITANTGKQVWLPRRLEPHLAGCQTVLLRAAPPNYIQVSAGGDVGLVEVGTLFHAYILGSESNQTYLRCIGC